MLVPEHLADPLRWKRPRLIFVNSMSDLFHPNVPDEYIAAVFGVMMYARRHTFQVLTKRPERMAALLPTLTALRCHVTASEILGYTPAWERTYQPADATFPLPNVWLGASVEDQPTADERIPHLLNTPAAVRFLSCEPLLGPITLTVPGESGKIRIDVLTGGWAVPRNDGSHHQEPRIHWVIVGGESGAGARPMHPDWARSLRDQCVRAGVPFFFKQWGEWVPIAAPGLNNDADEPKLAVLSRTGECFSATPAEAMLATGSLHAVQRLGKHKAGRHLDCRAWDEMPIACGSVASQDA
jgi:protein gp37